MAVEVIIPNLGITMESARIFEWYKRPGDKVERGETLFVLECDKATENVEAPASGILSEILLPEGTDAPALTRVAYILEEGETPPDEAARTGDRAALSSHIAHEAPGAAAAPEPTVPAQPAARAAAARYGLDLRTVPGTGPDGIVLLADVEAFAASSEALSAARTAADDTKRDTAGSSLRRGAVLPFGRRRSLIAARMCESKFSAPHVYFFVPLDMEPVLHFHRETQPFFKEEYGIRLSVNDLFVKAAAMTLPEFPAFNGRVVGEELHIAAAINVGFAVAAPDGLVVPAVADADRLDLAALSRARRDLVRRALEGGLHAEEASRGTFTVSSLAHTVVTQFTGILNPPQTALLSIPRAGIRLSLQQGVVRETRETQLGLAVDHRVIDGADAARFLEYFIDLLLHPIAAFTLQPKAESRAP